MNTTEATKEDKGNKRQFDTFSLVWGALQRYKRSKRTVGGYLGNVQETPIADYTARGPH